MADETLEQQDELAGLTDKQRLFVIAYTGKHLGNATQAARAAGYEGTDVTLAAVGHENLRKPQIASAVKQRMARLAMPDDEIVARLAAQARGSIDEFVTINGHVKVDLKKARAADAMGLVKKLHVKADGSATVELHDSQAALEKLARISGLLKGEGLQAGDELAVVIRRGE